MKLAPISNPEDQALIDRWRNMKRTTSVPSLRELSRFFKGQNTSKRNQTADVALFKKRHSPEPISTTHSAAKSPKNASELRPISALRIVDEEEEGTHPTAGQGEYGLAEDIELNSERNGAVDNRL